MYTTLRHILRSNSLISGIFRDVRGPRFVGFQSLNSLRRYISTQTWKFKDKEHLAPNVYHHTVSVSDDDQDEEKLVSAIYNLIVAHPDSLFFSYRKKQTLKTLRR